MYLRAHASQHRLQRQASLQEALFAQRASDGERDVNVAARPLPTRIDAGVDEVATAGDANRGASSEQQQPHTPLPISSLLSCALPAALVDRLCPLPAPTPSLFNPPPPPHSPASAASFLPDSLSLRQAVRGSRYYDAAFFIEQGADVTEREDDEAEGEEWKGEERDSDRRQARLTLTDELMRVAMQAGQAAASAVGDVRGEDAYNSSRSGASGSEWPATLLLLLQHGAPSTLSASLTSGMCGLASSSDARLLFAIATTRFHAIVQVALALIQQRHAQQVQAGAASKETLLATHQRTQDRLVDALTRLQLDEEREGRERNKQTATSVRYDTMAAQVRRKQADRLRRREEQLALREADIRGACAEREKKLRSLLAEIDTVRVEDAKLSAEVERRRLQLLDTTSAFDSWLRQRQADRSELARLVSETAAMEEEIGVVRGQREQVRQLRSAASQLWLQRQRVEVECGAADVQYVMERKRGRRSHLFFRFHRATAPPSSTAQPLGQSETTVQFEPEPCVESAVFPSASSSQPPSASSLSNPSWPPLTVDLFALCRGDDSAPFRVLLCDADSASASARSALASVRSSAAGAAASPTGKPLLSPSSQRYPSASSSVAVVGVCETSLGQLRRSGGQAVHVRMRASEEADAPLAGVFHFLATTVQ